MLRSLITVILFLACITPDFAWAERAPDYLVLELDSFEVLGDGDPDKTQETYLVLMASCPDKTRFLDRGPYSFYAKDPLILGPKRPVDLAGRASPPRFIFPNPILEERGCKWARLLLIDKKFRELAAIKLDLETASNGEPFDFDERVDWSVLEDHRVRVEGSVYPAHSLEIKKGESRAIDDTLRKAVSFRNRSDDSHEYLYVFHPRYLYVPSVEFPAQEHVFFLEMELCGQGLRYNPFTARGRGIQTKGRGYQFEDVFLELPSAFFLRQGGPDDETWSLSLELILQRSLRFELVNMRANWGLSDRSMGHARFDCHDIVFGGKSQLSGYESDFIRLNPSEDGMFDKDESEDTFRLTYQVILIQVKKF